MHFSTSGYPSEVVRYRLHGKECCCQFARNIWVKDYGGILIDPGGPLSFFVKCVLQNLVVFPVGASVIFVQVPCAGLSTHATLTSYLLTPINVYAK